LKGKGLSSKKGYNKLIELLAALLMALIIGGVFFRISGYSPLQIYQLIFQGAFGNINAILTTLTYATPLILSGLAFTVAKQANIMNLGTEGQLYVGAMTAAIVGTLLPGLPGIIYIPLMLFSAFAAAGLYGGLAGFLNIRFGSNMIIVTIMMNYISQYFCGYLVTYPLRADAAALQTAQIAEQAVIGRIFRWHQLSGVFILAVAAVVAMTVVIRYTRFGFHMRTVGFSKPASETAGINYKKITLLTMFLSAGIAGLCGAGQVMGVHFRYIDNFSSGFGFEGVAVAALAANNPAAVLIAGILFGGIKAGAMSVNRIVNLPMDYIFMIQALVIIFIAAPKLIHWILDAVGNLFKRKEREVA